MDDLTDAINICSSNVLGYAVQRNPPAVWVGGNALVAVPAAPVNWLPSTNFTAGQQANANKNVYQALTTGTSFSSGTGPSGSGQVIQDGPGMQWKFIGPKIITFQAFGSAQPVVGAELDRLPEEYRTKEVMAFWTSALLQVSGPQGESDIVTINGFQWQVTPMQAWESLGNYRKVLLVRVGR